MIVLELGLVALLILVNGFFAMSELAVVSSRPARLKAARTAGDGGATVALALKESPGRFFSTVQVGITLAGMCAGTFSGATLADELARGLESLGSGAALSRTVALAAVVTGISYVSLVFGELVPKQIALRNAERIATRIARPLARLSRVAAPVVWLLDASARLSLQALGVRSTGGQTVSEEEIKALIGEAESAGVVEPVEKAMITRVMRLGDSPVGAVMTRRGDLDWIDLDADPAAIRETVRKTRHARLPAANGSIDTVVGIIETKDVLDALLDGRALDFKTMIKPAPAVLDASDVLDAVAVLRKPDVWLALVVDEYGLFRGIVTTADVLRAIAGTFGESDLPSEPLAVRRADGSWLLDGAMPVDEAAELLGVVLPAERAYHTVAGFVLTTLKHLPTAGEWFIDDGWRFEVVDMDGRRVDKVLATSLRSTATPR